MGLRPAKCYRRIKRAFCRTAQSVPRRNYIGATPGLRVRQFNMGNPTREFNRILDLKVTESLQIRDNALEAMRIAISKALVKEVKKEGFFMKLRIYPYHILRENKQAQGAGADRVTTGMSHSFGKSIGRSSRVRAGQKILSLLVDEEHLDIAVNALKKAKSRLPCGIEITIGTDVKSIGTKPKKSRVAIEEARLAEEEEAKAGEKAEGKEVKEEKKEEGKEAKKEEKKEAEGKEAKEEKKAEKK